MTPSGRERWRRWIESRVGFALLDQGPGDGVVLRSSGLIDERLRGDDHRQRTLVPPIQWTSSTFLFTDHLGMTRDPIFNDNVLYLLLEAPL